MPDSTLKYLKRLRYTLKGYDGSCCVAACNTDSSGFKVVPRAQAQYMIGHNTTDSALVDIASGLAQTRNAIDSFNGGL